MSCRHANWRQDTMGIFVCEDCGMVNRYVPKKGWMGWRKEAKGVG